MNEMQLIATHIILKRAEIARSKDVDSGIVAPGANLEPYVKKVALGLESWRKFIADCLAEAEPHQNQE